MEFSTIIRRIWSDIKEADLPPELHAIAFEAGLRNAYERVALDSGIPRNGQQSKVPNENGSAAIESDGPFKRLSAETGVEQERLNELIYFDADGRAGINGGARRLGKNNSDRTRNIALIVASAHHFGNDEIDVQVSYVRDACKSLGVYDPNNFSKHVAEVPGFILSGPKSSRVLRAKVDAAAKLNQLVSEILGESSDD